MKRGPFEELQGASQHGSDDPHRATRSVGREPIFFAGVCIAALVIFDILAITFGADAPPHFLGADDPPHN